MKILMLVHAVYPDPQRIVTGNSVRAYGLLSGLVAAGHQVIFACPADLRRFAGEARPDSTAVTLCCFDDAAGFHALLARHAPDAILVGYWELMALLPENVRVPVILDVVAPRVLEAMYQSDRDLADEVRQMLQVYRRADFFLAGSERQRHFLLPWLIMAGIDCRERAPLAVVPISAVPDGLSAEASDRGGLTPLRFVSGGVTWPWRRADVWFDSMVNTLREADGTGARLALFSGNYVYGGAGDATAKGWTQAATQDVLERHDLLAYGEMQRFLLQCHVGVELADRNVEREYSQSFRSMEFLRAGLPLICNDYLELAQWIRHYDAGWTVNSVAEVPQLVRHILRHPQEVTQKARNTRRLLRERFDAHHTIQPVLDFLQQPQSAQRGAPLFFRAASKAVPAVDAASTAGNPPVAADWRHRLRDVMQQLRPGCARFARRLVRIINPAATRPGGDIVMVTRADVFPANHGAAVKIDRTAAALSCCGKTVYLMTDHREHYFVYRQGEVQQRRYPFFVRWLAPSRAGVHARAVSAGAPEADAFMYYPLFDWSYIPRLLFFVLRYPVSIFQAEFPAYARVCIWGRRLTGGQVLLVEHNVEYQRLKDQTPQMTPQALRFLRQVEIHLCSASDAVVTVSERDRQQLIRDGVAAEKIHHIPHGVDLQAFDRAAPVDVREKYGIAPDEAVLVYHGTYQYPPNLQAMQVMADSVLPQLAARGCRVKVLAIGSHPPSRSPHADIIFTGAVDQVPPYLKAADLAVVPLLQGGGTRMKILDYFAAALPVVSTAKGIEGIAAHDGVEACITAGADEDFVMRIVHLLADHGAAAALGRRGRAFVAQWDWRVIAMNYLEILR